MEKGAAAARGRVGGREREAGGVGGDRGDERK